MPFCTRCGHQTAPQDVFCAQCGARQVSDRSSVSPPAAPDPLSGLSPRAATVLCYIPVVGWIAAVIVLAARRFKTDHTVRFHAFQGLYLFVGWLVVSWVVRPVIRSLPDHFVPIDQILEALILGVSVLMMIKASHDEAYVLPIIGELAQRSATEH